MVVNLEQLDEESTQAGSSNKTSHPSIQAAQVTPWNIARTGSKDASSITKKCWIVWSGIDLDHPDLNVNTSLSKSFLSGKYKNLDADDATGTGTQLAGVVAAKDNDFGVVGVAAGATVVSVRISNPSGGSKLSNLIKGIDYVAANFTSGDIALIGNVPSLARDSKKDLRAKVAYEDAVIAAADAGVIFVILSHSSSYITPNKTGSFPGRVDHENLYLVSAMYENDLWHRGISYGNPPIDYCEPGDNIYSTLPNGTYGYKALYESRTASAHLAGIMLLGAVKTDGYVQNDPDGTTDPIGVVTP